MFSGFLRYKTRYSYFNRNSTTVTNGIIDLFSRRSPEIKETFKTESMLNTTQWQLVFWSSIFRTYCYTFFFFFFFFFHYNIAKRSRNKLHTGTGLSNKRKSIGICTQIYIFISTVTKMHPVLNTMTTESKKIFTSVFLLLLAASSFIITIIIHLSSSSNLLSAQITVTALL